MGCHALLQGIFLTQGLIEPVFLKSPALVGGFFTTNATWKAQIMAFNQEVLEEQMSWEAVWYSDESEL